MTTQAANVPRRLVTALCCAVVLVARASAGGPKLDIMPLPADVQPGDGSLAIDGGFKISLNGYREPRLTRAAERLCRTVGRITGMPLKPRVGFNFRGATLTIDCKAACRTQHAFGEDEAYVLEVSSTGARLRAANPVGVLRGIATFMQLVRAAPTGFVVPAMHIEDRPRFPWRGLLMDVCRHWQPLSVIKRNLDGMAAVKLNVLHLHLSDDQAFRVQSKRYRLLHDRGSDGNFFTQAQLRAIVDYAHDRGIRVVPEFDMPGHTTSWLVGYPELAAAPRTFELETTWGVFDGCFDPTRDEVYTFLDAFFGEMTAVFPDPYFHIGGDEVNGVAWTRNADIQSYMQRESISDNGALQALFNGRVGALLAQRRRTLIGWDEVLDPALPKSAVIQSWQGPDSLAAAARSGFRGILSSGYYLDHMQPASFHYAVDPVPEGGDLTVDQRARVLGGEACMWSEYVTPETIDSRIWPRLAAIAERLWSPAHVTDVDDMYRRLNRVSRRLDRIGLQHRANYIPMLERLAGRHPVEPLKTLCDVVEPVKNYARSDAGKYTTATPLNRLVDAARPESEIARRFRRLVDRALSAGPNRRADREAVRHWLQHWRDNHAALTIVIRDSFLLHEIEPLSRDLSKLAAAGLEALDFLDDGRVPPAPWLESQAPLLDRAARSCAELSLAIVPAVRALMRPR